MCCLCNWRCVYCVSIIKNRVVIIIIIIIIIIIVVVIIPIPHFPAGLAGSQKTAKVLLYSSFCQKCSSYAACVKYYCFLYLNIQSRAQIMQL
jgi:hypothetical protein